MIVALYRHRGRHELLVLKLDGSALDPARTDREAALRWGIGLRRIASWLRPAR